MKKSLIALAAVGAFTGSAMAQSSVTLFGVVDLSVGAVDNDGSTSSNNGDPMMMTDGNASSRIGFRGVEDLGGGLRAGFWLEGALSADDGNQLRDATPNAARVTATGALEFRRRATLSLLGNWGEIRLGRDYTPTFWNWTVFDPFGTNGVGAATNLGLETAGLVPGGSYGTLVRTDNTVGYHLPAGLGGLYGQAMYAFGEGQTGTGFYGGRIGWAAGPFDIAAAYGATEVIYDDGYDGSNWNVAGSWNLGFMKLSAFYGQLKVDVGPAASNFDQENYFVGAWFPFGPWTLKGTWGHVKRDEAGAIGNAGDADQWAIGFTYDLSKRTAFYGTYSAISNDGTAFRTFGGRNAPTIAPGGDSTGWQLGVRHSF
jgi:predicted porin